jgi:imidazolonepropionase-like amidohydrolase
MLMWGLFTLMGAYPQTKPVEGIRQPKPGFYALTNAEVVTEPGVTLLNATVIVKDGIIQRVGQNITIPTAATVIDYSGRTVYPGFIDIYSDFGMPQKASELDNESKDDHWNNKINADLNTLDFLELKDKDLQNLRKQGFTATWIVPQTGIFRGQSAIVSLADDDIQNHIINDKVAQHISFSAARGGGYPSSLMGIIALIRQTFLDTDWYRKAWDAYEANLAQPSPEENTSLAALEDVLSGELPVVFEVGDDLEFLRAAKIINEFNLNGWIKASGMEYRIAEEVKKTGYPIITPLNFPDKLNANTPEEALDVELWELQHWYFAPENPKQMAATGVLQVFTRDGLTPKQSFHTQLRAAIERGLNKTDALAALTSNAAKLLGISQQLGTITAGKRAHFVVTNGDVFEENSKILDVWVDGIRYEIADLPVIDARGVYQFSMSVPEMKMPVEGMLEIAGKPEKLSGKINVTEKKSIKLNRIALEHQRLSLSFSGDSLGINGVVLLSARHEKNNWVGQGLLPDGRIVSWQANLTEKKPAEDEGKAKQKDKIADYKPAMGWGAYARKKLPEQPEFVVVKNATIWTCGPEGTLDKADMLIRQGKISKISKWITVPKNAIVIDAQGKHVTPGLIDAHSHTGIDRGVNEGTQAVTSEVRIGDVIDSYDIGWYRELAGGLTVANQLHGSANPIGGQNSVVKLRWSTLPDVMRLVGAPEGIKFALGENVKQSNWGDNFTSRYPQTRMGVETIIRDRFKAAKDYQQQWDSYRRLSKKERQKTVPPRVALELEALLEILNGKRLVHSHSYRQDEILMLCRVAQEFGFTIGTFQHVLEGYKVAEAIKEAAIGASTFSDWWAYKFEVYDAIPYNGALMHKVGVKVSFNSDSNELARRLNTEAAKAIKYGGLSPEEAIKFVTINPAIQLVIDDKVGSLEPGKDADFVIWSGNPLSTYSICEQTWIDGRKMFDRADDLKSREIVEKERAKLLQIYFAEKSGNHSGKAFSMKKSDSHSCRHGDVSY